LIWTLAGLLFGRFNGRRTGSWRATRLRIESDRPFAVEGDGEVVMAIRAYFSVVPDLLRVCT
jgi:diacylglycerol kinase family enzyme